MPEVWRCGSHALALARPLVMGIVNVTPDSFSDTGLNHDPRAAIAAGEAMLAAGADIVDVGGESTRPGAEEVPPERELERVLPVVRSLSASGAVVSIDTRRAEVAAACVAAGASIVNDVSGFRHPAMVAVAAESEAGLVVMHMRGEPRTMQDEPRYDDVVAEVAGYLSAQADHLRKAGVADDRIAVDPGIGFGKTTTHNLELLRHLEELAMLGYPIVVGASRKRFIGEITGVTEPSARLAGSIAAAIASVERGAAVVRVHDVADTVAALALTRAIRTETGE